MCQCVLMVFICTLFSKMSTVMFKYDSTIWNRYNSSSTTFLHKLKIHSSIRKNCRGRSKEVNIAYILSFQSRFFYLALLLVWYRQQCAPQWGGKLEVELPQYDRPPSRYCPSMQNQSSSYRCQKCWKNWQILALIRAGLVFEFFGGPFFSWHKTSSFRLMLKSRRWIILSDLLCTWTSNKPSIMSAFSKENWGLKLSLRYRQIVFVHW